MLIGLLPKELREKIWGIMHQKLENRVEILYIHNVLVIAGMGRRQKSRKGGSLVERIQSSIENFDD